MGVTTGNSVVSKSLTGSIVAGIVMVGWVYALSAIVSLVLGDAARFVGGFVTANGTDALWAGRIILFAMAPVWGLAYAYFRNVLPGSEAQRGLLFGGAVWLLSTLILLPLLATMHPAPGLADAPGWGALGFGGVLALLVSLTAHLLFGWLLGRWVGRRID